MCNFRITEMADIPEKQAIVEKILEIDTKIDLGTKTATLITTADTRMFGFKAKTVIPQIGAVNHTTIHRKSNATITIMTLVPLDVNSMTTMEKVKDATMTGGVMLWTK